MHGGWCFVTVMGVCVFAMAVVSVATPVWIQSDVGITIGLWQICTTEAGCLVRTTSAEPYVQAVRSFHIIGIIILGLSLIPAVFLMFDKGERDTAKILVSTFSIASSCFLISMIVFTSLTNLIGFSYGYSYILGWVAFGVGGLLSVFAKCAIMCAEDY